MLYRETRWETLESRRRNSKKVQCGSLVYGPPFILIQQYIYINHALNSVHNILMLSSFNFFSFSALALGLSRNQPACSPREVVLQYRHASKSRIANLPLSQLKSYR